MKEIPIPYVKANQIGIVSIVVLALVLQQPLLLIALWVIQAVGLLFGTKANLFVLIASVFLDTSGKETQAAELQRFNNILGMIFLSVSLIGFAFGWSLFGYIFAGMFALAAFVALCGFCIGCTIYFQYKQWKARNRIRR